MGFSPEVGIAQLSLSLFVSSSWSTTMTSIIFLFEMVHLKDDDFDEEVDVKGVLKSSIFVVQKNWGRISPGIYRCHQD